MGEAAGLQFGGEQSLAGEVHGHSVRLLRHMGCLGINGELSSPVGMRIVQQNYDDFETSVEENLKTDKEFRSKLEVHKRRIDQVVGGEVYYQGTVSMRKLIQNGLDKSREEARTDPRMWTQAERDAEDLANLDAVEQLRPGWARIALSLDPKNALREDEKYWTGKGYRKGIAYLQTYARAGETVEAGAYSVDLSDEGCWRRVLAEYGVAVPPDESPDHWLRHGIEIEATPRQAEQFVDTLIDRYYQIRSAELGRALPPRRSVTAYVAGNQELLHEIFAVQYRAVAEAIHLQEKTPVVHGLAEAMLQNAAGLNPEMRQQLIRIYNRQKFDDDDGRFMEAAVRYGAVEQLRIGLADYVNGKVPETVIVSQPTIEAVFHSRAAAQLSMRQINDMNQRLARNVQAGAEAGRTYGGCSKSFSPGTDTQTESSDTPSPQDSYGGRDRAANAESSNGGESGDCEYEHQLCYCCPYDEQGNPLGRRLTVKAKREKSGNAHCLRSGCGAEIDSKGKTISFGKIFEKAQLRSSKSTEKSDDTNTEDDFNTPTYSVVEDTTAVENDEPAYEPYREGNRRFTHAGQLAMAA